MAPIGVFDSGLGGLTVLRALRQHLPRASFVYLGDSANAPYGSREAQEIVALSLGQARYLIERHGCQVIVIACNTATAAAATALRAAYPHHDFVGMEPAVKPAAAATKTRKVGVLATVGTLQSARFAALLERYGGGVHFLTYSCPGWVEAVEAGELDTPQTRDLVARYVAPLVAAGADTLVLGCTHFPALKHVIAELAGPEVMLIDTGEAVARRVAALAVGEDQGGITLATTGDPERFAQGAAALLGLGPAITPVSALYWSHGELLTYA